MISLCLYDNHESFLDSFPLPQLNVSVCENVKDVHYSECPYDAKIEYLQSDGMCVIDTEIKANSYLDYEIKFQLTGTAGYKYLFGAQTSDTSNRFSLMFGGNNKLYFNNGNSNNEKTYASTTAQTTNPIIIKKFENKIYINNGTNSIVSFTNTTYETPSTIFIFSCNEPNNNSIYRNQSNHSIYYLKIGNLDLIPVRKGNEGFFYDKVSNRTFKNIGSGTFILGPDIN